MEVPLQLEIDGFELPDSVQHIIERRLALLAQRHPRLISCRIFIRAPDGHHRKGEPFYITLRFMLPGGGEVEVSPPTGALDARQADLRFAVDDAFRRASRRLDGLSERREPRQQRHRAGRVPPPSQKE